MAEPGLPPDERRRATILFADLSGYTAMAEHRDPEVVKGVVERCLRRLTHEIERHGGRVGGYAGDNVMGVFGAPVAHEDDPERAVRAGLAMQQAMEEIDAEVRERFGVRLELRVGINTGEILAGAIGETYSVFGDTVNVASRLESSGRPGAVTVGAETEASTRRAIEYRPLDPLTLKGKSEPVPAWEAVGLAAESDEPPAEAPFVGRRGELERLLASCRDALSAEAARVVLVSGQAGVGKSRLVGELCRSLGRGDPAPVVRWGARPRYAAPTYAPFARVVRVESGITRADGPAEARAKLDALVREVLGERPREADLLAAFLAIGDPPEAPGRPEEQRDRFLASAAELVEGIARRGPRVLVFEDLHDADAGMLALVRALETVRAPLAVVCTSRSDAVGAEADEAVALEPLGPAETRELVAHLAPGSPAPALATAAVRSGGNPLFAEEICRLLVARGPTHLEELPGGVRSVLAARLDALDPDERRAVQHAAVIGRTFTPAALAELLGEPPNAILAALERKAVIERTSDALLGVAGHAFRHVLFRDAAYAMLPKATCARLHAAFARHVEERAGETSSAVTEHWARAAELGAEVGLEEAELEPARSRAVAGLVLAGDGAARIASTAEALGYYDRALALGAGAEVHERRGDVLLRLGRPADAVAAWDAALAADAARGEREARLHAKAATALLDAGDSAGALDRCARAEDTLESAPAAVATARLHERIAWLRVQAGDWEGAQRSANRMVELAGELSESGADEHALGRLWDSWERLSAQVHEARPAPAPPRR